MQNLPPLKNYEDLADLAIQRIRENDARSSTTPSQHVSVGPLYKDITPRKRKQIVQNEEDAN